MLDVSVVRLDWKAFRSYPEQAEGTKKKNKGQIDNHDDLPAHVVTAIVEAHGCVTPKPDAHVVCLCCKTILIWTNHSPDQDYRTQRVRDRGLRANADCRN